MITLSGVTKPAPEFGSITYILEQLGLESPTTHRPSKHALAKGARERGPPANGAPGSTSSQRRHVTSRTLDLDIGRRGVSLTKAACCALCAALAEARSFAKTGRCRPKKTPYGELRTSRVGGVTVLEICCETSSRPLRMTKEKLASVLEYEREIRAFARTR